ncbi:MAG TPA: BON domain-containing protein [Luteimonas sp.]|nr:BON domain-containing protein [Luteimonas sp.]
MQLKFLVAAMVAATTLSACTRPVVVETPAPVIVASPASPPPPPDVVVVPVPVPAPMPMPPAAPMSLQDRVHAALEAGMGSAASGIDARVDGSAVYLSGHVTTKADRDRAHTIAHDVPGVTRVDHSGLKVP